MTFAWDARQFADLELFRQYLSRLPRPSWVRGVTVHHTLIPTQAQWRGMQHMTVLERHYRVTMKWPAGPHLFISVGAPDPRNDGIFIGTPLDTPGVHAGVCNSTRIGLEVVGDFDKVAWPEPLEAMVYGVLRVLATWGSFTANEVNGHRECLPNKSCPGTAINMAVVRAKLADRLQPSWPELWGTLTPYHHPLGIPTRWRTEYLAGRHLGQALTDEVGLPDGRRYVVFEKGMIVWSPTKVEVWR